MNVSSQSYAHAEIAGERIKSVSATVTDYSQSFTITVGLGESEETVAVKLNGVKVADVIAALNQLELDNPDNKYPSHCPM